MPIKDNRSSIEANNVLTEIDKSVDSSEFSSTIDTADFDNGVTFVFNLLAITGSPTVEVTSIFESDDPTFPDPIEVPTANLIGTLPITLTAVDVPNASLNTLGVFGTKRFIRAVVNFIVSPGTASFVAWGYKTGEVKAVIHPNDGN